MVAPSTEAVADGSYPVSRSLYIYVNTDKAATNPALVSYVDYYLGNGYQDGVENAFGPGVGYVALPADIKAETDAAWASAKTTKHKEYGAGITSPDAKSVGDLKSKQKNSKQLNPSDLSGSVKRNRKRKSCTSRSNRHSFSLTPCEYSHRPFARL